MEPVDAAATVLREEGTPLHWTRIQDLALRRGYLDPFGGGNVRRELLAALAAAARAGTLRVVERGVYALPSADDPGAEA
jgi:hypothetical protein